MPPTLAPPDRPTQNASPPDGTKSPVVLTDQEQFDSDVIRNGRVFLEIVAGVAIFAALIMSTVALLTASGHHHTTTTVIAAAPVAAVPPVAAVQTISLSAEGGIKKGPDGRMHDAFSKTNFSVKVGQPLRLRIDNKDDAPHSITAAGTGVNITVRPGTHTYTLIATKAGRFEWMCILPCDPWAMMHPGYMAGYITAT